MSAVKSPIPVLPLRDIVVFPNMIVRLFVGRVSSTGAHDPKQLYGASVGLSSPAACPSRARPWDVRVELFGFIFYMINTSSVPV